MIISIKKQLIKRNKDLLINNRLLKIKTLMRIISMKLENLEEKQESNELV